MKPSDRPSPVSGEIVTQGRGGLDARTISPEIRVVDADFETVSPARPGFGTRPEAATVQGLDSLRTSTTIADTGIDRKAGPAFWLTGTAVALGAFWIAGGHAMFPLPLQGAPTAAPGLQVVSFLSRVEDAATGPVLYVEGRVGNSSRSELNMPTLGIDVRAKDGSLTRYMIGSRGETLGPGSRFDFSSRLAAPAQGVDTVSIHLGTQTGEP